jgi:hypothetical protein
MNSFIYIYVFEIGGRHGGDDYDDVLSGLGAVCTGW